MPDAYRDDLAFIHDAGFGNHARAAAPVFLKALRQAGIERGLVVELGCGSGILSAEIVAAGYDLLGFDISPAMVALARKRVPKARFKVQSLWSAEIPPCSALVAVGEILNYLFDETNSDAALSKLFRRVRDALRPGGVFLFDISEPSRLPSGRQTLFREGADWAILWEADVDRLRKRLTRRMTSFRKVGKLYRRDREVHELRLLQGKVLAEELRQLGFRVRLMRSYGSFRFPPGVVALLARVGAACRAGPSA
jgi:SAM-dependent methyltransferase